MVIRKPYAFLIKHFKKIHIALLIFSLYIYYKIIRTNGFVNNFVTFGSYDANIEPISKYITTLLFLIIILSFVGNLALILLLRHKDKPWRLYLLPLIEYAILFFILIWTKSFFNFYDGSQTGMDIRLIRDIMFITTIAQFPIIIIYSMRILGVDLQKFNFKLDEEYLELEKEDREELEININIDYHMFIRFYNKSKRYLKYFYLEHKRICNCIAIIIAVLLLRKIFIFVFVTNKSYEEGEVYDANGYTIVINKSYYTDKDKSGNIIEDGKAFIVVDLSIKNNWGPRDLNMNNYHIIKGIDNYHQSDKTYSLYFDDIGKTIEQQRQIKRDETINTIIIFKVDRDTNVNLSKYILYYQEINGANSTYLRKIKLKITDISKIKEQKLSLNQKMPINTVNKKDNIIIEKAEIKDSIVFSKGGKVDDFYEIQETEVPAKLGSRILEIEFASDEIDGKELIDFSTKYGKIKYDDNDKSTLAKIESTIDRNYYGKYMYINVPYTVEKASDVELVYTIRDKRYIYRLSEGE